MNVLYFSMAVLFLVVMIAIGIRMQKNAKYILLSSGMGLSGLLIVNLLSLITKVGLGFSIKTIGTSIFLGLPGIVLMLFLKLV